MNQIASVGMGRMGRGIAITFAYAGYPISLIDLKDRSQADYDALKHAAAQEIRTTFELLASLSLVETQEIDSLCAKINYVEKAKAQDSLAAATLIFEGVPETREAKRMALSEIGAYANQSAVVASTTSTMLSTELQHDIVHPERFLNAHWLNPAYLVPLVEISPGDLTDPAITQQLVSLLEEIGKVPVVCAASPGYIVPRIQALAMNEAARMVEEGVASVSDIDKATKYGFGFRFAVLGLLEFIDWGGGDILYHASRYMESATGDSRHRAPDIVASNMREGRIGLSTQQGFLDYTDMDVPAYQQQRLGAFVSMLRHIDKLPKKG